MGISNGPRLDYPVATTRSSRPSPRGTVGRSVLVLTVLGLVVVSLAAFVGKAALPIPMTTQGSAYDRAGVPLPIGTPIHTFIDGVDYSATNRSTVFNATGAYSVLTQGNAVINATTPEPSPIKYGANAGETVQYAASDFTTSADVFQETSAWHSDLVVALDLHLGSVATTPEPLKIQALVALPARGGAPYVYVCNPASASVSLGDYYLQRDAPGTYYGANLSLAGGIAPGSVVQENLTAAFGLIATGDALKLVYRNPGGASASAGGADVVIDRLEFNASVGGTLDWQPGATIMGSAPAPGPGQILERSASCGDTNSPGDFHLAEEPGLPPGAPPVVRITAPTAGQSVQGGQAFTLLWTMTDDVFAAVYLRVWVNVTVNGVTTTLVGGDSGRTSVNWDVPNLEVPAATVQVSVIDPRGEQGNATTSFRIAPATPYSAVVAAIVVVVIAVFVLWAYLRARREAQRRRVPPSPPPAAPSPPSGPPAATAATAAAAASTKICPRCHTAVKEADETCFFCGYSFVPPP